MSRERSLPRPDLTDCGGPLFADAADPLLLLDPTSGAVLDANPEAQRLTGFGRDDLRRLPLQAVLNRRPGGLAELFEALRESRPLRSATGYQLRSAKGPARPVTVTLSPLTGPRPLALLAVRLDPRPDATLRRLRRRDAAWRRLLASVADCVWS